ncbi:MAG: SdrD B-like domain-containing protein [Bacteroidota bacterium]
MNHFYRGLTLALCFMVSNLWGGSNLLFESSPQTICADRTASNTTRCMNDVYLNTKYGGYLLFKNLDSHYKMENGKFQEFVDGTAKLTGRWINIDRTDIVFDVAIDFAGRTEIAPNAPKEHFCLNANPRNFYYYTQVEGELKGRNAASGAKVQVTRFGEAFQVGVGANITHHELTFGASGWLATRVVRQPSGSLRLEVQTSPLGGNGDININLSGDGTDCSGSKITLTCQEDIRTVAAIGASGKQVLWSEPTATTTCRISTGQTCAPTNIAGFEYMGEFNGSRYYCSERNNYTWLQAREKAMEAGGYLAVICNAAENEYLRNGLLAHDAWIGYSDRGREGDFVWVTGENCSYTNWRSGEPNNFEGDEDFTRILKSSGKWTDRDEHYKAEFIMEIPCEGESEPGGIMVTQIEGPASGSVFPIGETKLKYEAVDECGNMEMCMFTVTVNPAPTGEITLTCNDDITAATVPGGNSVVVEYTTPTATTTCPLDGVKVELTSGLASGSEFPVGETTITYTVTDACGSVEFCTFKVVVTATPEPCLVGIDIQNKVCDNNGTPSDPNDDTYTFDVVVQRTSGAAETFVGSYDNPYLGSFQFTGNYGEAVTLGPFLAGDFTSTNTVPPFTTTTGLDINVLVIDAENADCKDATVVTSTGPCSDEEPKVKVGNKVFLDANGNGIQDEVGEDGISGVIVNLLDEDDDLVAFTTTDNSGMYMIGDLAPGSYKLQFLGPNPNLEPTQKDATDDAKDSDIDENGLTELFTLTEGFDDSRDAGFVATPDPCLADAGTLTIDNDPVTLVDGKATISATPNGDEFIPEGFSKIYVLTSGEGLVIEQVNAAPSFEVMAAGKYTIHTLVYDDNLDLNIVVLGLTTGFDVNSLLIQGGGDICASLDVAGAMVMVMEEERCLADAGTLTIENDPVTLVDGKATISATPNGDESIPDGFSKIYVLTSGEELVIEQVNATPSFEVMAAGKYTIHTLVYDDNLDLNIVVLGLTTGFDVNSLLIQGGGDICASLDVAGAMVVVRDRGNPADCESVTAKVEDGKVTIDGLTGSNSKVEIIGAGTNWTPIMICGDGGDACQNPQMISDLAAGEYTLKIQLWGADGSYCYTERKVTIPEGDPTCQVLAGTISTSDDITNLCVADNEPSVVNFSVAGGSATNTAWVVTDGNGRILNPAAPSTIDFEGSGAGACNIYYVWYENIDGLAADQNIADLSGCFVLSNQITVTRKENCDQGGEPQCADVDVSTGNGKINLVGLSAPFVVVKVHDMNAGWAIIRECVGCEDPTTFNVPEGDYMVVIEFYRGFWNDKYCREDVPVTVGGGDPCTDNDEDGVCVDEDCDDNNPDVGAKQTAGISCDDGNANTINDQIQADGCTCAGEEETDKEICIERDVFNTDNCQFNIIYGLYLKLDGYDEYYEVSDASFVEYTDGTARLTATATNNTTPGIGWNIDVTFGERTTLAEVSPKEHNCLSADVSNYYFYETLEGKLTGINDVAGASMTVTRIGPAFQIGVAANITHKFFDFGGSGWFVVDNLVQPTNGPVLILNAGAQGQNGDFNINLSGDGTECIEGRDNSELDCANVTVIATDNGIAINGLTAPIEILKVFDSNWNIVDECTADCGESRDITLPAGNYRVSVNFYTANWIQQCEVIIPVTIPASANGSASSRQAPTLNMHTFEDNRAVTVEWLTNTGYKNQAYEIEKSTDGTTFEAITKVANEDTSDDLAYYKGQDQSPVLGTNYYRVKQTYHDGSFDYSEVQVVNFDLDLQSLAVFPNPVKDELFVSLKAQAGQSANLQIINNYGQVIQQIEIDEIPVGAIELNTSSLQNGLYHLSIRVDRSNMITKKILVSNE